MTCPPADLQAVKEALAAAEIEPDSAEITMLPATTVACDPAIAAKVLRLIDALEDHDDVQKVFHNADIPQAMIWSPGVKHLSRLPENIVVIPVLHPAGIMRSTGRDELLSFRRGCQKVKLAVDGKMKKVSFTETFAPPVEVIDGLFARQNAKERSKVQGGTQ